jgi:hypothetical protein
VLVEASECRLAAFQIAFGQKRALFLRLHEIRDFVGQALDRIRRDDPVLLRYPSGSSLELPEP